MNLGACHIRTVEEALRAGQRQRFARGLIVRVSDGGLRGWYNDWSGQPTRPVLRGRVISDGQGVRISGSLSWLLMKSWPLLFGLAALVCFVAGASAAAEGDLSSSWLLLLCALGFTALGVWDRCREAMIRTEEEERLRAGLGELLRVAEVREVSADKG
jgi:hypothetical protein